MKQMFAYQIQDQPLVLTFVHTITRSYPYCPQKQKQKLAILYDIVYHI